MNTIKDTSKYEITTAKKSTLAALKIDVLNARHKVTNLQAIVTALTVKLNTIETQLSTATSNQEIALHNLDAITEIINTIKDVMHTSSTTFDACTLASIKTTALAKEMNTVMNKLIFAVEVINKLSNLVELKKAQNPLISDELVEMLNTANTDANNAVALSLIALQNIFVAQSSTLNSEAIGSSEYIMATKLYEYANGEDVQGGSNNLPKQSIKELMNIAYTTAKDHYQKTVVAHKDTLEQLQDAQSELDKAQAQLKSLEAALAAAEAAALAS